MASYAAVQHIEDAQARRQNALERLEIVAILARQRGEHDLAERLDLAIAQLLRQKQDLVQARAIVAPAKKRQ